MLDLPSLTPVEKPLSEDEWQAYLPQHALYAQRRYRYHTRQALSYDEFLPSLVAYQRLTHRRPERLITSAIALLEQFMAEDPAQGSLKLWELLTGEPDTTAWDDLASLPALCDEIAHSTDILRFQKKRFTSNIAKMSSEWRRVLTVLAVVMEERALLAQPTLPPLPDEAPLAPYPDGLAWRKLVMSDPGAARERLKALEIQRARSGISTEFNALESRAIGHKLLFPAS